MFVSPLQKTSEPCHASDGDPKIPGRPAACHFFRPHGLNGSADARRNDRVANSVPRPVAHSLPGGRLLLLSPRCRAELPRSCTTFVLSWGQHSTWQNSTSPSASCTCLGFAIPSPARLQEEQQVQRRLASRSVEKVKLLRA